jgi:cysteine desulfurase NifS/selenium donor protein
MDTIYLDYNATTPIDPAVAEAMSPYIYRIFGNPSSSHSFGISARQAVEKARKQIAVLLGCDIDEIIFTSGGSESNNYAIKGVAMAYRKHGNHIITSQIEHPAVTEVCRFLEQTGYKISYVPVDSEGIVDPSSVEREITPQTILITIMHANNEVGTIQPLREITKIANRKNIIFHSDCAQSVGKIPVNVKDLGVDLLSIAGHKLYAPKGVGALYLKNGVLLEKYMHGADHELNRRAGTENVIEIVGLGKACELVSQQLEDYHSHMKKTREYLEEQLKEYFTEAKINGHPQLRLPNTTSVSFPGLEANTILDELQSVAASAGAACHSESVDISHVLEAMQIPTEIAMGTIRFSVGRSTTIQEIDHAITELKTVVEKMQPQYKNSSGNHTSDEIKLTHFTHGLGCACKLRPQILEEVLKKLPVNQDSKVLVGPETSDDAAVYQINDETAIIQTVDFFTPVVDDPYQFGSIAASNSLSDIYAMGGKPLFALNIVGFPSNRLPISVLEAILKGAADKAEEAGIVIIGGHTVDDTEPKFGMAVTGVISPQKIIKNNTVQVGDELILTKPIGSGILATALKRGMLDHTTKEILTTTMSSLNNKTAEIMQEMPVHACTDVTGFGLLGHLLEMLKSSGNSARIKFDQIPTLPQVMDFIAADIIPGGTKDNWEYTHPYVAYDSRIGNHKQYLLNDAQTSGGLLIAVKKGWGNKLLNELKDTGNMSSNKIGLIEQKSKSIITVDKN